MKEPIHIAIQAVVFISLGLLMGWQKALLIVAAHFIPTIDFIMKKLNFQAHLHRKLFHNLFVMSMATIIVLYFGDITTAVFFGLNFLLHILMDAKGKGVAIFFPLSDYRFKL